MEIFINITDNATTTDSYQQCGEILTACPERCRRGAGEVPELVPELELELVLDWRFINPDTFREYDYSPFNLFGSMTEKKGEFRIVGKKKLIPILFSVVVVNMLLRF